MNKRIKKNEVYENRFYRIPKAFFKTEKYKKLSLYAKVIYGFLDDRRELSLKNNWVDRDDNIYLIFTRKEIEEMLCLSNVPVTNAFKELKEYGLIEEERQGLNKPNLIYVCHIDFENIDNMRIHSINESRNIDNRNQDSSIVCSNDTELNKTDFNETEKVLHHLSPNNDTFISFYLEIMKQNGKKPKRHSQENYDYILNEIEDLKDSVDEETWQIQVLRHFSKLPKSNDGDILPFLKASARYFMIEA